MTRHLISLVLSTLVLMAHSGMCAPIPIEDIYLNQLPDPGMYQTSYSNAADTSIAPTLIATGFDLNDTSEMSGKGKR